MSIARNLLLGICCLFFALFVEGASLDLLLDINSQTVPVSSRPEYLGAAGSRAVFRASREGRLFGGELYASDGTPQGTVRLLDGSPGGGALVTSQPITVGGRVLFFDTSIDSRAVIWATDGMPEGTRSLVADAYRVQELMWLGTAGDLAYFTFGGPNGRNGLWRTDGTPSGTQRLFDQGSVLSFQGGNGAAIGSQFYFVVSRGSDIDSLAVYTTDGTVAGTRAVYVPDATQPRRPRDLFPFQGRLLLHLSDGTTFNLFSLDPATGAVTQLGFDGVGVAQFFNAVESGGRLIYASGASGESLWATDGTPGGTVQIAQPSSFSEFGRQHFAVIGSNVLFTQQDNSTGRELWITDGTPAGTRLLVELTPGPGGSTSILASDSARAFLVATGDSTTNFQSRLWVSDATETGTREVPFTGNPGDNFIGTTFFSAHIATGNVFVHGIVSELTGELILTRVAPDGSSAQRLFRGSGRGPFQVVLDRLFFVADAPEDQEPWVSDGTVAGTRRVSGIAQAAANGAANPSDFARLGNVLLFSADDGVNGRELWLTDGTAPGTSLLVDIVPGAPSSNPVHLQTVGDLVYFLATSAQGGDIWRTDGTVAGTFSLGLNRTTLSGQFTPCKQWIAPLGNRVVFGALDAGARYGMWSSDGSPEGTSLIRLIVHNGQDGSEACQLTTLGAQVLFSMVTGSGRELWRTDGTGAGTVQVKDISPNGSGFRAPQPDFDPPAFLPFGAYVYFLADDGSTGTELWRSDGTPDGTALVIDLHPGLSSGAQVYPRQLGDQIVFGGFTPTQSGIFITDGTSAGTRIARDQLHFFSEEFVPAEGRLFFFAEGTSPQAVWSTDGTAAGTRRGGATLLLGPAAAASDGGVLFFTGGEVATGAELWMSDGTVAGTRRLSDIAPGDQHGVQAIVTSLPGRPLVVGKDPTRDAELFVLNNVRPVAADDVGTVAAGSSLVLAVRNNDSDPDGDISRASARVSSPPANGAAVEQSDGSILYTPRAGFSGTDSFEYVLTDDFGASASPARVTVTITAPPPPPVPGGGGGGGGGLGLELLVLLAVLAHGLERSRRNADGETGLRCVSRHFRGNVSLGAVC